MMQDTNTASGAAMQLADQYAAAHAKWALEDLYGTSKSYTAKMLKERHALRSHLAAALASAAAPAEQPLPLLVRDIAAELGCTPIQVCNALAEMGIGNYSVNMAVTPTMAKSLRKHFEAAPPPNTAYAALPDTYYLAGGEVKTWDENHMRAFADATCALRIQQPSTTPQADSQPAPANTRQIAECYGDCPEDPKTCRNQCKFEGRAARAPAESVLEDAARYQYLRNGDWRETELEPFIRLQLNALWDSKIDAAIAQQKAGE